MQEILVNVDKQRNKTIVVVENGRLVEKYQENDGAERLEGNIYIGKVQNVLLGMQAAFVDIGKEKNTFIHIRDVMPKASNETGNKNEPLNKYNIKDYIRTEMPILVQVKKDSTSKKGARVSTHMNISGRYIVLMPNSEFITVSKKIEDIKEKNRLLNIVKPIVPKGYGIIIRTSAEGKNETEIKEDRKLLGLTEVTGQGFIIKLDDNRQINSSEVLNVSDYLVHEGDLTYIVNELFNAGADAIAINDQRITSKTSILCDGNIIRINGEIVSVPITIQAIGYPERMEYALGRPGGYLEILANAGVQVYVQKSEKITLPKYEGVYSSEFLTRGDE